MKIQFVSDLHLEYAENRQYLLDRPLESGADLLILAGDIITDESRSEADSLFNRWRSDFDFVAETMGNHEFYGGSLGYAYPEYSHFETANHLRANNAVHVHNGVRLVMSTLWSHIDPGARSLIESKLNDYRHIRQGSSPSAALINVPLINVLHLQSVNFLKRVLEEPFDGLTIVITHHLPSLQLVHPKWQSSPYIPGFASDLDDFIKEHPVDLWVFGHQHESVDMVIGQTRFVSNPMGYMHEEQKEHFARDRLIDLAV